MKNTTHPVILKLESLNRHIGQSLAWLSLAMVVLMFINVVCRYVFQTTLVWQQELVMFMHAMLFLGAAGYTLQADEHVRVDVLYQHFSVRTKAWVLLLGTLFFLFPFVIVIACASAEFILHSWGLWEASREYNGMQGVFLLKTCIWLFCGSLFLQGCANICRAWYTLQHQKQEA